MSWAVVSTMNESAEVAARFVAYYLALGAERVHLYFDGDRADAPKLRHEKLDLTVCDAGYWREVGKAARPEHQEILQSLNANHAYAKGSADWLLHVDADEYLAPIEGTIEGVLAASVHDLIWVRSFEPLAIEDDGNLLFFRPHLNADLSQHVDGRYRPSLLLEHDIGKSFVRQGLSDVRLKIHSARLPDKVARTSTCATLGLLHYLNFGAQAWAEKYADRIARNRLHKFGLKPHEITRENNSIAFYFEILDAYNDGGLKALIALFQGAKFLNETELAAIYPHADFFEFAFDFGKATREILGEDCGEMTASSIMDWGRSLSQ